MIKVRWRRKCACWRSLRGELSWGRANYLEIEVPERRLVYRCKSWVMFPPGRLYRIGADLAIILRGRIWPITGAEMCCSCRCALATMTPLRQDSTGTITFPFASLPLRNAKRLCCYEARLQARGAVMRQNEVNLGCDT